MADLSKHTPGRWMRKYDHLGNYVYIGDSHIWQSHVNYNNAAEDAELIAAAPTLLEQNKKMREALESIVLQSENHNELIIRDDVTEDQIFDSITKAAKRALEALK